jgi:hypothetical protein
VENGGQPAFRLALRQSGRGLGRKQPRTSRERCYAVWTLCDWVRNCDRGLIYGASLMHMPAHWNAVSAIVLLGVGILTGVKATRQKDPAGQR